MGLSNFAPQSAEFEARLIGGGSVKIELRPYTLADDAWYMQKFPTQEDRLILANLEHDKWPDSVARMVWRLMTPESKKQFDGIVFEDYDEDLGETKRVKIHGYEKILHSFESSVEILKAWNAVIECRGLNDFVEEQVKKKMAMKK